MNAVGPSAIGQSVERADGRIDVASDKPGRISLPVTWGRYRLDVASDDRSIPPTSVTFDGLPASFTVNSDTQIVAISPPHASGFVDVTITTPHGTVVDPADAFPFIYD